MLGFDPPQDPIKTTIGWIEGWLLRKKKEIVQAFQEKGGWEVWAQVELAEVLRSLPGGPTVQREHGIYEDPREAVDFYVSWRPEFGRAAMCIELKCEALWQSAAMGRVTMEHKFHMEVSADIAKLRLKRKDPFAGQPAYVIAITLSEEAAAGMREALALEEETLDFGTYKARIFVKRID